MHPIEPVPPLVLGILRAATVEGTRVTLNSGTLYRALYLEVNEVLERLGGTWTRRAGAHVFPYDPAPLLRTVLESGRMPARNPLAFFPTPEELAAEMVRMADLPAWLDRPCRILEPQAGRGAIARALRRAMPEAILDLVELDPWNAEVLRREGWEVHQGDFLDFEPAEPYDAVLMNPPFSVLGDRKAYVTHILHAWAMVREGGSLVAIAPEGFVRTRDPRLRAFRLEVATHGGWQRLPRGTFAGAGTHVATVLLWMEKEDMSWRRRPYCGWPSWHTWAVELLITNEYSFYQDRQRLFQDLASGALPLGPSGAARHQTDERIREYYREGQEWALEHGNGVDLCEADYAHLVQHLISEFRNEYGEAAPAVEDPPAPADPPAVVELPRGPSVQLALF